MAHSSKSTNDNTIASLHRQPFRQRSKEQQFRILHKGRPTPVLEIFFKRCQNETTTPRNVEFRDGWSTVIYNNYLWLTGDKNTEKLHCWPCLLMWDGIEKGVWLDGGDFHLKTLSDAAHEHCISAKHLDNMNKVAGLVEEVKAIMLANLSNIPQLNKKAKNRALLKKLVEVAIMVYTFDLSVEYLATDWLSAEKFQALFDLAVEGNESLVKHCKGMGNDFTMMIRTFFHDFLDCLQGQIQRLGYLEIVQSSPQPLCSIQLDSIRDVDAGKNSLLSIVLSYVNTDGVFQQHFFGFESNTERTAATVSRHVEVAMVRYRHNAVSQSYDGACVMVDELTSLKQKIQITAPSAVLIPSIDHPLNQVLMQGVFNVRGVQLFVATIQDLVQNPKQLQVLSQLQNPNTACVAEAKWNIDSKFLSFLLNERESFISAFEQPPTNVCVSAEMIVIIKRLVNNLQDLTFMFLLVAFVDILKITDELADVLSLQLSDVNKCSNAVTLTITNLRLLMKEKKARQYIDEAKKCTLAKKANLSPYSLATLFDLVIENLILQIKSRFGDVKQFEFLQLTDSEKFIAYAEIFPASALISLDKLYGKHFNIKRLEKELKSSVYCNPRFRSLSAIDITKLIQEIGLKDTIPQAYKLFCLVVTLPITPVEGRDCFKHIQSFMDDAKRHNNEKYENHRSLPTMGLTTVLIKHAQVVIERPLVLKLFAHKGFRDTVIQQYITMKKELGVNIACAP